MNLTKIEKLMYEIELENDKLEIEEEKISEHNSDYLVWVNIYNDLNKKSVDYIKEINKLEEELRVIEKKENLLNGQLTRKDKIRKEEILVQVDKLNKEIEINNKNKKDASETCKEIIENSQSTEYSKNIKEIKKVIEDKTNQINDIYYSSKDYIDEYDKKINNVIEKIKEASLNNDVNSITSYSIELSKLQAEKNDKYYDNEKIIKFVKDNNLVDDSKKKEDIIKEEKLEILGIEDKKINNKKEDFKKTENKENTIQEENTEILGIEDKQKDKINDNDIKDLEQKIINSTELDNTLPLVSDDEERIFTNEERIDSNHIWMNVSNAFNTGNVLNDEEFIINNNEIIKKDKLEESKVFVNKYALKIKNIAKLGVEKSKMIASKIKNSKIIAGAIEAIENDLEKNRGRI